MDLVKRPISHYLGRFNFQSDLVKAMWATTDAFSGLNGGWDTPGTGMNFLVHNMVRFLVPPQAWCTPYCTRLLAECLQHMPCSRTFQPELPSAEVFSQNFQSTTSPLAAQPPSALLAPAPSRSPCD
jgi:hypothetical protein